MSGVRPRLLPSVPPLSDFPELNLRTYVTAEGRPGVWFFSLDAHNPLAVRLARATFKLPYFDARMSCETESEEVRYHSTRTHRGAPAADFVGRYRPVGGPLSQSKPGTLENFLTERYCLYAGDGGKGRRGVLRGEIHHQTWPLYRAEVELETEPDEMTAQIGVRLPRVEPVLHFSRKLEVHAWLPRSVPQGDSRHARSSS